MRVFRCVCSAVCVCVRVLVDTYLWAHLELLYRVGNDAGGLRNCCAGHARGQLLGRRDLGLGDALPGGWNLHAHAVNMNVEQTMRRSISKELQTSRSANGQQGPTECECVPRGQQGGSRGGGASAITMDSMGCNYVAAAHWHTHWHAQTRALCALQIRVRTYSIRQVGHAATSRKTFAISK